MDTSNDIKTRYAEEALTYRKEAPLVNFDSEKLFAELIDITSKIFTDDNSRIKVLDIGAGNGMLTELIINKYPNAEITMLDFSKKMLQSAKEYFKNKNIKNNINYVISNFITDELPNGHFDLIISSYALHHIRSKRELKNLFLKVSNSLKDNIGTFLCVDMYLGTGKIERDNQVTQSINKWTINFGSLKRAIEWGNVIKNEDTPATIPTIMSLLYECESIPLLTNNCGILATLYGMTKLSFEALQNHKLNYLISSYKNKKMPAGATENEYKIGVLPFKGE